MEGYRLSQQQKRAWILSRDRPELPWGSAGRLRLSGEAREQSVRAALSAIVERHEILRTRLCVPEGMKLPLQVVQAESAPPLRIEDLRGVEAAERERRLEEIFAGLRSPAGPDREIPLRAVFAPLSEDSSALLLALAPHCGDAVSIRVLADELSAAFSGSPLPADPMQYADYAQWQHDTLPSEDSAEGRAYWRALASESIEEGTLPGETGSEAGAARTLAEARVPLALEAGRAARELAERAGADASEVWLAAWAVLLARMSAHPSVRVGVLAEGRSFAELDTAVGPYAQTLPMTVAIAEGASFREILDQVRETRRRNISWQDAFDAGERQTPGSVPRFGFDFAEFAAAAADARDSVSVQEYRVLQESFDLRLSVVAASTASSRATAAFLAGDGRLPASEIELLAERFAILLRSACDHPEQAAERLALLPSGERKKLLIEWNDTGSGGAARCVHEFFEDQVRHQPDRTALTFGGKSWTYAELDARAERIAAVLRGCGIGPDSLAGIRMERDGDMIAALLGVLKSGGAYLPLDPAYPNQRVQFMLEDSGASLLLTQRRLLDGTPKFSGRSICVDDLPEPAPASAARRPTPGDLAYVIYTSGSTGKPKGVAIEHRSVSALLHWARAAFEPRDFESVLASTSICFDISVFELYGTLAAGGEIVLARDALETAVNPAAGRLTLVNTVPSAAAALLAMRQIPKSVRIFTLCGEPLTRRLADGLYEAGVEKVYDFYGPSEDTVFSTVRVRKRGEAATIGRPMPGTQAYVVDRSLEPVPTGVAGELLLGGAGLARGYLGRPEQTAEKFVAALFPEARAARVYRTGDLVRYFPDGNLEFLGRLDHQVKIRGFRIELGEIESVLLQHPSVSETVVLAREGPTRAENSALEESRQLVAYLVACPGARADEDGLRRLMEEKLPAYMAPAFFVWLEAFPRMPNGKLDRAALPAPQPRPAARVAGAEPRNEAETILLSLWRDALAVQTVGVEDDFFEFGGDSIQGAILINRLQERIGEYVSVIAIFEAPTVSKMAEYLSRKCPQGWSRLRSGAAGDPARGRGDRLEALADKPPVFPLTPWQRRVWLIDELEDRNPAFNLQLCLDLSGPLDRPALQRTVQEVVRRHETLRSRYFLEKGELLQEVRERVEADLPISDLADLPETERERALSEWVGREFRTAFDLDVGPVFRCRLYRMADNRHVFTLIVHQIAVDAWSHGILLQEIGALYEAFSRGRPSPLQEPAIQHSDYVVWLRGRFRPEALEYWKRHLESEPPILRLPTDVPREALKRRRGATLRREYPGELAALLKSLSQRNGATVFITSLSAFHLLLARWSGQRDFVIGTTVANRGQDELSDVVGRLSNMVALRLRQQGGGSFLDFLADVRAVALGAYGHQDVALDSVIEAVRARREPGFNPLYQVVFAAENIPSETREHAGVRFVPRDVEKGTAKYDLTLVLCEAAEGLHAELEYDSDLFDDATAARLLDDYERVLREVCMDPKRTLEQIASLLAGPTRPAVEPPPARRKPYFEAPRNETERVVASAWQTALRVDRVGTHDDFFDLGGSSLLALKVSWELGQALGVKLGPAHLFEAPTPALLAELIETVRWAALGAGKAGANAGEPMEIIEL